MDNVIKVNFTGPNRGKIFSKGKEPNRMYGVLLVRRKDRAIGVGYVITNTDIEVWCQENNYDLVKSFRFNKEPSSDKTTNVKFHT